jgi:glycyl-tRNA synthetase beta chain
VTITRKGRPTKELLAEALPGLIAGLHVPKAMRWGSSEFEFVRPIRNILCLFGEEVVDLTVDGVKSGNTTWGHRLYHRQHPEPIVVKRPEDYEAALKGAGIVVSFAERKAEMEKQLHALAAEVNGRVVTDDHLLDTLAEIVEMPNIVRGDFPRDFLELPKEVLVTSLKEHQKAFCVEDAEGNLLPHFLTAANRADDPKGFVKAGNEWVLKARLYDARFFFAEDRKHPLETRLEALKQLTFQRELGSYFDKTERVMILIERLARELDLDEAHAKEAARLAKCDLRTLMVGEFPELQGVMGGEYLKRRRPRAGVEGHQGALSPRGRR